MPNDCKIFFGAGPYSVGIGYPKLGFGFEHNLREDFFVNIFTIFYWSFDVESTIAATKVKKIIKYMKRNRKRKEIFLLKWVYSWQSEPSLSFMHFLCVD